MRMKSRIVLAKTDTRARDGAAAVAAAPASSCVVCSGRVSKALSDERALLADELPEVGRALGVADAGVERGPERQVVLVAAESADQLLASGRGPAVGFGYGVPPMPTMIPARSSARPPIDAAPGDEARVRPRRPRHLGEDADVVERASRVRAGAS